MRTAESLLPQQDEAAALSSVGSEELVARAQAGDRVAFEELYHRFYPAVVKRLTHLMGPSVSVNDLVQETFVQAYRHLSRFRGEGHFCHWVLRIASNVARSNYRRTRRSIFRLWERPELEDAVPSPIESVDEAYPTLRAVHQALEQLSPPLREAVVLFELEGMSLAEIASELGVPLHTVASRLRRGRERLRKVLEGMGFAPLVQTVALCSGEPR